MREVEETMNIVTHHLLQAVSEPELIAFVEAWDRLESLVIDIYKRGCAEKEDTRAYPGLKREAKQAYKKWKAMLEPHWRGLAAAGRPVEADPFLAILGRSRAQAFVGDWAAMQTLPAARQAINHLLIEFNQG
jgi:hypothetical protein